MLKSKVLKQVGMVLAFLTGCGFSAPLMAAENGRLCIYSSSLRERLMPLFSQKLGADLPFYDLDHPAVLRHGRMTELRFLATLVHDNSSLTDAGIFVVKVNICSGHVFDEYFDAAY